MNPQQPQKQVLVTGGSGFLATHAILQLLQNGYRVKTTLRSLKKKDEVIEALKNGGIVSFDNLQFVEADLTRDDNWNLAAENCEYVLHIASPIFLKLPKDENEMIRPAVDGTLRVLKAARNAGVKRVVMTSNLGAVCYSQKDKNQIVTEECWTDPNEKGLSAYNKSKVLAERAAWDFMEREGGEMELAVVNPVAIFGPSLNAVLSSGFEVLRKIMNGSLKMLPNMIWNIVDVRDVADLHLRAMTNPAAKGQRFLATSDGAMSLPQMAKLLKEKMPEAAVKVSVRTMPDWVVRLSALFSAEARAIVPMLNVNRNTSNQKARNILSWQPRSKEEAILAAAESLIRFGIVNN